MNRFLLLIAFSLWLIMAAAQPTIYQNTQYGGQSTSLYCSDPNLNRAGWGDCISSVTCPDGWIIVFYEHSGYRGHSFTVGGNVSYFSDYGWNDAASSVAVYHDGILQSPCVWLEPETVKWDIEPGHKW